MGFPGKTAWISHPGPMRPTPRPPAASRSELGLGSSSGLPSTTLAKAGAGLPSSRSPARRRNASKSSRRMRRLIVEGSGDASGRVRGVQFPARHAQRIGRSRRAAQAWTRTISAAGRRSLLCRPNPTATAEIAADNSAHRSSSMRAPSWLEERHGLELREAQGVGAMAHYPPVRRGRAKSDGTANGGVATMCDPYVDRQYNGKGHEPCRLAPLCDDVF
jgi:hypothetical protein